jgi:hypothetical protein
MWSMLRRLSTVHLAPVYLGNFWCAYFSGYVATKYYDSGSVDEAMLQATANFIANNEM